jgi:hypothetical protein
VRCADVGCAERRRCRLWAVPNVGLPNVGLPNVGLPNVGLPTVALAKVGRRKRA